MPPGVSTCQPGRSEQGEEVGRSRVWFRQERQGSGRVPWNWPGRTPEPDRIAEGSGYMLMSDYRRCRLCPELFRGTLAGVVPEQARREKRGQRAPVLG